MAPFERAAREWAASVRPRLPACRVAEIAAQCHPDLRGQLRTPVTPEGGLGEVTVIVQAGTIEPTFEQCLRDAVLRGPMTTIAP